MLCFVLTLRRPSTSLPSRRSLRTTSRRGDSAIGFRYPSRFRFRPAPFPVSCGTGSGHFRFRPVAELVPATSVSGQLRNWFRPLPFPASCGTGCRHDLDFPLSAVPVIKCKPFFILVCTAIEIVPAVHAVRTVGYRVF
jgi:hypothetical protein